RGYLIRHSVAKPEGIFVDKFVIPNGVFDDPVVIATGDIKKLLVGRKDDPAPGRSDLDTVQFPACFCIYQLDGLNTLSVVGDGRIFTRSANGDIERQISKRQAHT